MLTIENIHVTYQKENEILKGINLSLHEGEIHGLVGLNGAGKTTLLNTLFQFIRPQSGSLIYNKEPLRREEIGYLEAENFFYPYMTGNEYLDLFSDNGRQMDYETWAELFNLPLKEITETYSTGMRKKLALLAILKQNKPILILDEPFNGLDLESVEIVICLLNKLRTPDRTILVTSHIFETLTHCCDRIHYLEKGVIRGSYSKEEFGILATELQKTIYSRIDTLSGQLFL